MKREHGFTLIELLVVVAIIGVLAAIAIPQFSAYRQRAFDARAKSDIVALATAEEAYFVDKEIYVACADAATCKTTLPGFVASNGVDIEGFVPDATYFTATAYHSKGAGITFNWDSSNGGLQ